MSTRPAWHTHTGRPSFGKRPKRPRHGLAMIDGSSYLLIYGQCPGKRGSIVLGKAWKTLILEEEVKKKGKDELPQEKWRPLPVREQGPQEKSNKSEKATFWKWAEKFQMTRQER